MTAPNPMLLTLVAVPCESCGSTADTVKRDRKLLANAAAVCCRTACWFCGTEAPEPYWLGKRPFCCKACAGDWAA